MAPKAKSSIPEVSEKNFKKAPRAKVGAKGAIVPLPLYQKNFIEDRSRIKVAIWPRQTGKDYTGSLDAVLDGSQTRQDWFIISLGLRQALATGDKCKQHCKAVTGAVADFSEVEWEYERAEDGKLFVTKAAQIILPAENRIICLPGKDPNVLAGLTGNIVLTEFALFPNKGVDHWRVLFPLITRGFRIIVLTTPRGPDTKAAELRRNVNGKYSVHNLDIYQAVKQGLDLKDENGNTITPQDLRELYNDEAGWAREYECKESDEIEAFIDWASLQKAETGIFPFLWKEISGPDMGRVIESYNPARENMFAEIAALPGEKSFGWDIAVKHDLSVMSVFQKLGDVKIARACVVFHKVNDFDYQETVAAQAMRTLNATGVGDETGLGAASCQALEKQFPMRFKGCNFATAKLDLATGAKKELDGGRVRLPSQHTCIGLDWHAVHRELVGAANRPHLVETRNPELKASHCDIFYSQAMALDAALTPGNSTFIFSV